MKRVKLTAWLLSLVMLLSLFGFMSFSAAAAAPTTLPDLSGAGIPIIGFHYGSDHATGKFTHYPAKTANCAETDLHTWGDDTLGKLTNSVTSNGSVVLPEDTQGKAFVTTNLFTGELTVTAAGNVVVGNTLPTALNTVIPSGAVGFLFCIESNADANAAIRINPVISELTAAEQSLRTVHGSGSYVYFYDEAQNKWGASPCEHAYRVPGGDIKYIYIPFETWQITANKDAWYSNAGDAHAATADMVGKTLTNIEFSYTWGAKNMVVKSVDLVSIDTSNTDEWDGTADTSWFDPSDLKTSYTLDTAEKVAGLAKIVSESGQANYPYCINNTLINFYITKNLDLKGQEWLPIGETYNKRFGGNIIGKLGGVEGAAVTIKNMTITRAADENTGFIGSIDGVSKETGAQVKNLYFENASVITEADTSMGIVCGYARSGGVFENIKVYKSTLKSTGGTAGLSYIGGIVGYSKYGNAITLRDCSFDGNLVVTGGSGFVGGIIGEATTGAIVSGCYVGGQIVTSSSCAIVGGLVANVTGGNLMLANCQMDANMRTEATGALIGAMVGNTPKMTANMVLHSGVGVQVTVNGTALLPWVGTATTDEVTMAACYSMSKTAAVGSKATLGTVTVKNGTDLFGDAAKTALADLDFAEAWATRDGMYPVLANVADTASIAYANMDLSWYDPTQAEMQIGTLEQLVGFARAGQLDSFNGKTVKQTADIDGTNKLPDQALTLGSNQEGILQCLFLGTFDTGSFVIRNITFSGVEGIENFIVTWIIDGVRYEERYKYGETPVCKESTVKANDDKFSYEFKNWAPVIEPVTKDVTYEAIWRAIELEPETEPATEPVTEPATEPTTDAGPVEQEGCSSVAGISALALLSLIGMGVVLKRKK